MLLNAFVESTQPGFERFFAFEGYVRHLIPWGLIPGSLARTCESIRLFKGDALELRSYIARVPRLIGRNSIGM